VPSGLGGGGRLLGLPCTILTAERRRWRGGRDKFFQRPRFPTGGGSFSHLIGLNSPVLSASTQVIPANGIRVPI
jgi:hypothetical protein